MHPLIADGGEMTVLRDLAAFSYGRWSVDWPESVPEEQRPELPDDRDFGYASKLKRDPGRFGRRFVRADVTIKAQDFDEAGKPISFSGESDVEETLDDAAKRTDGDVFFEREITRAGLGALVPRVDFDVDSVVPVLIWGKTIPSPVTSIEDVVEQGAVVDYRVHVGGQLLQDDAARERANREVERTIAQERRERVKAVSKAQSTASSAKTTADSAKGTADAAKKTADETAALVEGLDIEGSIQEARDAVDSSNAILQLVRQLTGAAAAQGAQAQASASLAIEYARQAEEVLDKLDPLRDDVVAAHAEVARLSGEAAKAAQDAAAAVAQGEKHVVAAQRAATAAAQDAATSQGLVDEAKALLSELSPLQDAARKSLADAQSLLDNAGGTGKSLADVLKEVAAKHQAVLSAHDDILATHGEVLEIHGEAIRYAAMAAAQAGAAAMQASQAAAEALRAADLNAQAVSALAEADEKLIEADRKLQEQIDVLEESQRLLAQAVRYVAAAAAQAAQAAMSAAQASEENANAIEQTNVAVDAAADSLEALQKAAAARDEVMGNIQKSVDSVKQAQDARDAAQEAQKADFEKAKKLQTGVNSKLNFERPKFLFWGDETFKWQPGASSAVRGGGMKIEVTRVKDLQGAMIDVVKVSKTFAWKGSVAIDTTYIKESSLLVKRPGYGAYDYDYQFTGSTANPDWSMRSFSWHLADDAENNQVTIAFPAYRQGNSGQRGGHLSVRCIAFPQDADIAAVTK